MGDGIDTRGGKSGKLAMARHETLSVEPPRLEMEIQSKYIDVDLYGPGLLDQPRVGVTNGAVSDSMPLPCSRGMVGIHTTLATGCSRRDHPVLAPHRFDLHDSRVEGGCISLTLPGYRITYFAAKSRFMYSDIGTPSCGV